MRNTIMRIGAVFVLALAIGTTPAEARTTLKSICRVKGQEENTLHGLGFVMGLKGTGDGGNFLPTIRSLAKAMALMGEPLGEKGLLELKDAKNVALVAVTATVPAAGARQGDQLDCTISSIGSASSLAGGQLFLTPLLGPDPNSTRIYGFARGLISLDNVEMPTAGRIHGGCQLEADFFNLFVKDGMITLVLDKNHADFQVAQDVAELINSSQLGFQSGGVALAKAINQLNIEVTIPPQYLSDSVLFVSQVLGLPMLEPQGEARVVINERSGSIVIGGDVEIGEVVVSHKNVTIETGTAAGNSFVAIDVEQNESPKLRALVAALEAVHVSKPDMIDIIKGIDRNGKLHAKLIIE